MTMMCSARVVLGFLAKCFRLAVIEAQLPASPAFGLHALAGRRRIVLGLASCITVTPIHRPIIPL